MRKILFFGDSLTAGYGLKSPYTESYPALIQQKLSEEKLLFECMNAGVSGDTTSGGLARLDRLLLNPIDGFILELGINDFLRGLPISATYTNLDKILEKVSNKYPDCKLVVMGMDVPQFLSNPKIDAFKKIFQEVAEKHHAVLIPFFLQGVAGVRALNLADGIHPSSKGYQVIAEHVWPVIRKVITNNNESAAV